MNAPRSAAMSMTCFIGISHTVQYLRFKCSLSPPMCCTLPLFATMLFFTPSFHRPAACKSAIKCRFTRMNSPARVRRV